MNIEFSEEVKVHLKRVKRAYKAAKELQKLNFIEDAYSRAYYALLHICYGMLINANESLPKTHEGLVAKLYSKKDKLNINEDLVKKISRFQSLRANGDYSPIPSITNEDFKEIIRVVESLFTKLGVKIE